jgi:hypothetical protein
MAKGSSGRLVIEIDPLLKEELYQALGDENMNLKQWFLQNVSHFLKARTQPSLPFFNGNDVEDKA